MQKYLSVFRICWEQGFVYRLNFTLWRVRTVLQLLLIYFIWWSVFQSQSSVFGYTETTILTYIIVSSLIRAIVLSSRTMSISNQINDGSLANFLVRPLGFIKYHLTNDIADKLLNISFVIVETYLLIYFLKPPIIWQTDLVIIALFILAATFAIVLNFCLGFMVSLTAFWVENSWGPQFLFVIFLEGFGGWLFPIDILPKSIYQILMLTPFPYLVYFPSKIYLGAFSQSELAFYFPVLIFWVVSFFVLLNYLMNKGLRHYSSVGH